MDEEKQNKLERIDKLIAKKYNISRVIAQDIIKNGKVLFKQEVINKPSTKINVSEKKQLKIDNNFLETIIKNIDKNSDIINNVPYIEKESLSKSQPVLKKIYEDDNFFAIDKPKNLVIYPGVGKEKQSVLSGILGKVKLSNINPERPGIVHRLDKDTTGVVVLAKNNEAHEYLANLFKQRKVHKTYLAIVRGNIIEDKGKIDLPIKRSSKNRQKMAVEKGGRQAVTYFEVLERFDGYTFVKVNIETGRTHQIRVHFSEIGRPVLGDAKYSNGKNPFNVTSQLLHASEVSFKYKDGKDISIKASIPEEMQNVLEILRKEY